MIVVWQFYFQRVRLRGEVRKEHFVKTGNSLCTSISRPNSKLIEKLLLNKLYSSELLSTQWKRWLGWVYGLLSGGVFSVESTAALTPMIMTLHYQYTPNHHSNMMIFLIFKFVFFKNMFLSYFPCTLV